MEYTQGYGTIIIKFDQRGKPYLTAEKGRHPINEVLPDALEYVTLYARQEMWLKDVSGVDIIIEPNMSKSILIEEFKKRKATQLEVEKKLKEPAF